MSRIVDLDALEPEICKACAKTFCKFPCEPADCDILRVLRNAPTIEQPTWIKSAEKLPPYGATVLVYREGAIWLADLVSKGYFKFECWELPGDEYVPVRDTDHWTFVDAIKPPKGDE